MKRIITAIILSALCSSGIQAQGAQGGINDETDPIVTNGFWNNWYVQAGLDMTLLDPYGKDFSKVIPHGKSFGIDAAVGKWFSPQVSIRGRVNWQNGLPLLRNGHLTWLASDDDKPNSEHGGFLTLMIEAPVSLSNIIWGYDSTRRWNFNVFPRAGLGFNFAISSSSPTVGGGFEFQYKLDDHWGLNCGYGFQAITSEFFGGDSMTGMGVSTGFNCFMDFEVGVIYNIGNPKRNAFRRVSQF